MSTAPNGFQTPKTNWSSADVVSPSDTNRIEGNINAIETGSRTIDPAQAPTGNSGTLRQLLDWFANRIKAITGATNWYDAPVKSIAQLNTDINNHASTTTGVHGATSAATPNTIVQRDSAGRAKVAAPSAADDIARKDTVDGAISSHVAAGDPHTQYLLESSYTASDVLAKIKTVDGAGSGLDADTLDGVHASGIYNFATGTFTGDGTSGRVITVGFTPRFVMLFVVDDSSHDSVFIYGVNTGANIKATSSGGYIWLGTEYTDGRVGGIVTNGFKTGYLYTYNVNGVLYRWFAWL